MSGPLLVEANLRSLLAMQGRRTSEVEEALMPWVQRLPIPELHAASPADRVRATVILRQCLALVLADALVTPGTRSLDHLTVLDDQVDATLRVGANQVDLRATVQVHPLAQPLGFWVHAATLTPDPTACLPHAPDATDALHTWLSARRMEQGT